MDHRCKRNTSHNEILEKNKIFDLELGEEFLDITLKPESTAENIVCQE